MTDDPLRFLLGPDRPEVTCEECFERLPAYVEAEVVPGRAVECCDRCDAPASCSSDGRCARVHAHLEGCPACREEYEVLRELVLLESADDL